MKISAQKLLPRDSRFAKFDIWYLIYFVGRVD